jgi:hypothetical protein
MLDIALHDRAVTPPQFDRLVCAVELEAPGYNIDELFVRML